MIYFEKDIEYAMLNLKKTCVSIRKSIRKDRNKTDDYQLIRIPDKGNDV